MADIQSHAQVVVVGGGVVGASILYHLTKNGWTDAVLLDQCDVGAAQRERDVGHEVGALELREARVPLAQRREPVPHERVIRLREVSGVGTGITPILYNLAFSPRIKYVDISNVQLIYNDSNTCEGIYKLVKISGSLEYLNMNNTQIFDGLTEGRMRGPPISLPEK